jgi:hypothetical protein
MQGFILKENEKYKILKTQKVQNIEYLKYRMLKIQKQLTAVMPVGPRKAESQTPEEKRPKKEIFQHLAICTRSFRSTCSGFGQFTYQS